MKLWRDCALTASYAAQRATDRAMRRFFSNLERTFLDAAGVA